MYKCVKLLAYREIMYLNNTGYNFNVSRTFEVNLGTVIFSTLFLFCYSCVLFNVCWLTFVGGCLKIDKRKKKQPFRTKTLDESF